MNNIALNISYALVLIGPFTPLGHLARAEHADPVSVVQTMEHNFGVHHGYRRNHAKGFCATGSFQASAEAKALSKSTLFDGKAHPAVARYSSATGLPTIPDTTEVPHGLGLEFELGEGHVHNFSMIDVPYFVAATPEAFVESLKASTAEAVQAFQVKYPESKPFYEWLGHHNPPASFATDSFYSLNAFEFVNEAGKSQFVRWHFSPEAGDKEVEKSAVAKASPNFLEEEFKARVRKGPARWTMIATLAEKGDNVTNATEVWPKTRKEVTLGTLTLTEYSPQASGPCNKINYDPTRVSEGVNISDDPILHFRAPAYAVSYSKRMSDPVTPTPTEKAKPKRKVIQP